MFVLGNAFDSIFPPAASCYDPVSVPRLESTRLGSGRGELCWVPSVVPG